MGHIHRCGGVPAQALLAQLRDVGVEAQAVVPGHQDAAQPYFGRWVSLVFKRLEILRLYLNPLLRVKASP